MDVTAWLLDSDPALRWQVQRDLAHEPEPVWQATRERVATEGIGARLLSEQDPDGQWAGGAFFPKGFTGDGPQPWTATTWTLNALREWGMPARALGHTAELLERNSRWEYDDLPYWGGEVDCCINSWTVSNGLWLGADIAGIVDWFVEHRLDDGGWNCEWEEGSVRSSFHSTLNTLKGLLDFETATGGTDASRAARRSGEEYLLTRRLLNRLTTGEYVAPWVTRFEYPSRWRYTALRATDYFRSAALLDGTAPDPRIADAIEVVRSARQPDGTWLQQYKDPGLVWFDVDVPAGQPSRWITFTGTRVLDWWDAR